MTRAGRSLAARGRRDVQRAMSRVLGVLGGRGQGRAVLVLAAVLALNGANTGSVSATAGNLEQAFHIGNTQIGLLLSVAGLVGALFSIPVGVLTDRTTRTRLLGGSVAAWAVAVALSGAATLYLWLLLAQVALGIVTATSGPTVASLTGDFFPVADRARMYGLIIAGELAGTGIGYVISGDISSLVSWRVAFWWLVIPSLALAWLVWRLPEPARGGSESGGPDPSGEPDLAGVVAGHRGVRPQQELVLHSDPTDRPLL